MRHDVDQWGFERVEEVQRGELGGPARGLRVHGRNNVDVLVVKTVFGWQIWWNWAKTFALRSAVLKHRFAQQVRVGPVLRAGSVVYPGQGGLGRLRASFSVAPPVPQLKPGIFTSRVLQGLGDRHHKRPPRSRSGRIEEQSSAPWCPCPPRGSCGCHRLS